MAVPEPSLGRRLVGGVRGGNGGGKGGNGGGGGIAGVGKKVRKLSVVGVLGRVISRETNGSNNTTGNGHAEKAVEGEKDGSGGIRKGLSKIFGGKKDAGVVG